MGLEVKDGSTKIENKIFRIGARVVAYAVFVFYGYYIISHKATDDVVQMDATDWTILASSLILLMVVEAVRWFAKKKLGEE